MEPTSFPLAPFHFCLRHTTKKIQCGDEKRGTDQYGLQHAYLLTTVPAHASPEAAEEGEHHP
jgi:hypothetical protein